MNKKSVILSIFTFILILIISFDVEAINTQSSSSGTENNGSTSTTKRSLDGPARNNICKNYLEMRIDITDYIRKSVYKDGKYTDKVEERKITVNAKQGTGSYLVQVYVAPTGKLEKIENLKEAIKTKASRLNSADIDDTFGDSEDSDDEVRYFEKKFNTGSSSSLDVYYLPSGYEALVIMLNNKKKNSGDYGTTDVATRDAKGNPTSWYKYDVTCPRGNLKKANSNSEELVISGNAVSMYSQNPEGDTLVTNYNSSFIPGTACANAKSGIYDTASKKEKEKYSVVNATSDSTWIAMYNKVLGNKYCEQNSVSFNLDNDEIKNISNQLIKSYYYIKKLKQSSTKSYDDINKVINGTNGSGGLKSEVDKVYTNKKDLDLSLDCNYGENYKEKNFQTFLFYEEQIEKADIFNGKVMKNGKAKKTSVDVCKTICYEKLTVSYSPPVATKAGLCFQYKVTIKSKVECGVDADENVIINKMQLRTACNPEPICSNKESATQGGPNQQFDSCIKECDNGDYSQKCINKCYNKVYKKENDNPSSNKKLSNKNTNKSSVDTMELNSSMVESSKIVEKVNVNNGYEFNLSDLEKYYDEDTAKSVAYKRNGKKYKINCSTAKLKDYVGTRTDINSNLDICAEYFTQGKILNPMGNYSYESPGNFSWETEFKGYKVSETDANIVKQLGVAAPFYLRSTESTKKLIIDLVCPTGIDCTAKNGYGKYRKYSIMGSRSDYTGIKKQYSGRFKCDEECHFTGCNETDALTSSDYTKTIIDDLNEINSKLQNCSSTTACDKGGEKTTVFKIKVKTDLLNNDSREEEKKGTTESGNPGVLGTNTKPKSGDMFIPADDDNLPGIGRTDYGILGKCYDGHNEGIDYKTTITFPGSWINLKTGEVYYVEQPTSTNREKKYYYCSPYNSKDVNDKWFKWVVYKNSDPNEYPTDFSPTWNITADLGSTSENKKFGRYNWSVKFQCFYSAYNKTIDTEDVRCYKGDKGYEVDCVDDNGNRLPDGKSTRLQDSYDVRIANNKSIFPQKANGKTRLRGYNWGSQATLYSNDPTIQSELKTTGYGVDPVKYSTLFMEKEETQSVYDGTADMIITIPKKQMQKFKSDEFEITLNGDYTKVDGIPNLYSYKITDSTITDLMDRRWTLGENSKTAKEVMSK